jgi:hypothetical protein
MQHLTLRFLPQHTEMWDVQWVAARRLSLSLDICSDLICFLFENSASHRQADSKQLLILSAVPRRMGHSIPYTSSQNCFPLNKLQHNITLNIYYFKFKFFHVSLKKDVQLKFLFCGINCIKLVYYKLYHWSSRWPTNGRGSKFSSLPAYDMTFVTCGKLGILLCFYIAYP